MEDVLTSRAYFQFKSQRPGTITIKHGIWFTCHTWCLARSPAELQGGQSQGPVEVPLEVKFNQLEKLTSQISSLFKTIKSKVHDSSYVAQRGYFSSVFILRACPVRPSPWHTGPSVSSFSQTWRARRSSLRKSPFLPRLSVCKFWSILVLYISSLL